MAAVAIDTVLAADPGPRGPVPARTAGPAVGLAPMPREPPVMMATLPVMAWPAPGRPGVL